jgi:hypothetical protein
MRRRLALPLATGLLIATACSAPKTSTTGGNGRVSEFGRYEGYSEPKYSEWVRTSKYVTVRDGTKLAVDVIQPAEGGKPVEGTFPTLWTHSRYHRGGPDRRAVETSHDLKNIRSTAVATDSALARRNAPSMVDGNQALQRLVKHGYVVVSVQVRGGGASFGRYEGLFSPAETQDAYDVMDWMTKQPWSDGNLGMFGGSYLGITQYMAASTKHPALKAIFPNVAAFNMYDVIYDGGIYRENMIQHWGILTRSLDIVWPEPPVDADEDGVLRAEALAIHLKNWNVIDQFRAARFRDHETPEYAYRRHEPSERLADINQSGVAAYHFGGWYDVFARDEFQWLTNVTGPDRVTLGPWAHSTPDSAMGVEQGGIIAAEQHRWFDRWLKGIQNGIDSQPPINYALMIDPGKWTWQTADQWPAKGVTNVDYFFGAGPSGSIKSVNDGLLAPEKGAPGSDRYRVDLTTTTGTASRWDNAVGQGRMVYPDMAPNDAKALTYTTAPLTADLTIVGHPVVTVYLSSDQTDGDVYAILAEVDSTGFSRYVSEGMLRISHRDTTTPPFNNLGLPWQRSFKADKKPLPKGEVATLIFDLQPTATVFNAGHRLRVTIMGADVDNTEKPPVSGRPTVILYRDAERASRIQLPVMR